MICANPECGHPKHRHGPISGWGVRMPCGVGLGTTAVCLCSEFIPARSAPGGASLLTQLDAVIRTRR